MAKKKKKEEEKRWRYTAACTRCSSRFESDTIDDMPDSCCGFEVIINDNERLLSRTKKALISFKRR